jgi:RIO kinase 1
VDVVANPQGPAFLARDVRTMTAWFAARGMALDEPDAQELTGQFLADAGLT